MTPQAAITRDNHYVPQALLRHWSRNGTHVLGYRTLVSNANVDRWKLCAIKGVAYQEDFYTVYSQGQERDDFERFISKEYETPALAVIDRAVIAGGRLTEDDHKIIGLFAALQALRTPQGCAEMLNVLDNAWQPAMDKAASRIAQRLEAIETVGPEPINQSPEPPHSEIAKCFRVTLERDEADPSAGYLKIQMHGGRRYHLAEMKEFLNRNHEALGKFHWSVVEPSGDREWHLTDHPVIRLNYYGKEDYDFAGGWGNPGSEILLPVSPRHLLYTQVGTKCESRFQASGQMTREVQTFQLQSARRWIFATRRFAWIEKMRPREVNPIKYLAEEQAWKDWRSEQLQSEIESDTRQSWWAGELEGWAKSSAST